MYCPQCGAEFRDGFNRCSDCDVELASEPRPPEDHHPVEYVKVLETSEPTLIPVIKSLFDGAGIPFLTRGESMMDLFPSQMLGPVYKSAGAVKFRVPAEREEEARELLDAHPEDFEMPDEEGLPAPQDARD